MKHNPTIYSFILQQISVQFLINYVRNFLLKKKLWFNNLGDTIEPKDKHINALMGLEGEKMLTASEIIEI